MDFNEKEKDFTLNETFAVSKIYLDNLNYKMDTCSNSSDSNYASQNSEFSSENIDLSKSLMNDDFEHDKQSDLIDLGLIDNRSTDNWLCETDDMSNGLGFDFNFSSLLINVKIDKNYLLKKLSNNINIRDHFNSEFGKTSPDRSASRLINRRCTLTTSTPICNKSIYKSDESEKCNLNKNNISPIPLDTSHIVSNKTVVHSSCMKYLNSELTPEVISSNSDLESSFDKTITGQVSEKSFSSLSNIKIPMKVDTINLRSNEKCMPQEINSIKDELKSGTEPTQPLSEKSLNNCFNKLNTTHQIVIKIDTKSYESKSESPTVEQRTIEDMSTGSSVNEVLSSEETSPLPYKVPSKLVKSLKPQSRQSLARPPFSRPTSIRGSNIEIMPKDNFTKPSNIQQPSLCQITKMPINNRNSVFIRPKDSLTTQSKLVRQSLAILPSSNIDQSNHMSDMVKKAQKSRVSCLPQSKVSQNIVAPKKPNLRMIAPPKTIKTLSKPTGVQKVTSGIIPQPTIVRPSLLKHKGTIPTIPCPSDSVPLISPASAADHNPLNRTFDKQDFILLKSTTVTSNTESSHSHLDTFNNNYSNVYKIAEAEQHNLMKEAKPKSLMVPPRGLRPPTQIQSRAIPSVRR